MGEDISTGLYLIAKQLEELNKNLSEFLARQVTPEKQASTKKGKREKTTMEVFLSDVQIINETEKAFIVKRLSDGKVAVVAKSHLAGEYAKADIRQELEFKPERAWAIEKLEWKEDNR